MFSFHHGHRWAARFFGGTAIAFAFLLVGCGRDSIRVYEVSKDKEPPQAPVAGAAQALPTLKWDSLPAGWKDLGVSTRTRAAGFSIEGSAGQSGEVSVIALAGMGENDLEFVNMWRKQIGLSEVQSQDLPNYRRLVPIAGAEGKLFDMNGASTPSSPETNGVLVALLVREGVSWFFKLSGPGSLLAQQCGALETFLKGLSFGPPKEMSEAPPPALASASPPSRPSSGAPAARPTWELPGHWKEVTPGAMLLAKFTTGSSDGAKTDVTVSSFPGDVGGMLANINRWRGQLGLAAFTTEMLNQQTADLNLSSGKGTVVDFSGTDVKSGKPARLVGVVVPREGETWFYKMMGDPVVSDTEKPAFLKFVQSVKYSHGN